MKVDYGNNIQETHENNNAAFLPVTVLDPLDKDTTITVGPELPEVWYAVPLRTETYHGLGSRLMHPSPVDTIVLSQVEIPVYKTPGTWFDTSLSLIVEILTLDADQMPSTLIAVDTVPGYEIAANWALEDSLKYLVVDLAADKAAAGITLPPGVSCAVMVSQPAADPGNIYLPADDEEVIIYEDAGPCSLELSVALIGPPDKMATVSAGTSTSSYTTFTITGPTFITIPVVNEVTIEYMSHFLNNWPNSLYNGLWVDINDFWLERVGMFSLIDIEVVVAGEVTSYPRSSWEAFGGLSLPDAGMSYQVDGRHLIKVRVNGTEFYRDCFYNESKPLIDQAPWASIEEYDFQDFGGESYNWGYYLMRATAPSTRLGFDADFKIFGHNFENRLDLNLDFLQSYQTNNGLGQSAVTYNNIELVLMNKTLLDETIPGLYVGEFEVGDDVVHRLGIDPYEFDIAEIKVFDGRIFYASVWLGAIAFHVDANVKIELDLAIEAALSTFPEPYGELIVTPSVAVNANLEAELVLLWGVGKVGGEATGIVLMSFPLTMSIVGEVNPMSM